MNKWKYEIEAYRKRLFDVYINETIKKDTVNMLEVTSIEDKLEESFKGDSNTG